MQAANAATTAGTQISNTATATYTDSSSTNYSTNSNTVITVVQNAPTLTNTGSAGVNAVAGQNVTDSFVLQNTGNNGVGSPGDFQIDSSASSLSGGGSTITGYTYTYNGATSGTYGTIAALNTALASVNVAPSGATSSVTINVTYSIPSAAANGSISDVLAANLTYPGGGAGGTAWAAATSADTTTTITDTIISDARMDLKMSSSQGGAPGNITYTITANNGGSTGTTDLQVTKSLLGAGSNGVLISDKVPSFGGTPLTVTGNVTVSTTVGNGYNGANWMIYYTTNATGTAGWTAAGAANTAATVPASTTYIGIFVYGGSSGVEFNADAAGSTGAGAVTSPAMTISYTVQPPTGSGSGDTGAVTNLANAIWGDNQSTKHILAPGVPANTADTTTVTSITTAGQGINNTTSPPGANYASGYSNSVANQALLATGVVTGPCCSAANIAATGSYDGVVGVSSAHDFTAVGFSQAAFTSVNSSTTVGSPTGSNTTSTVGNINVENGVENTGNASASITISATAPTTPAGWTVGVYADNAGTPGALLTGASVGSTSTGTLTVASGATANYWAVYTAPSATPTLTRYDAVLTTTSGGSSDTTHNELYNGYIALTKSSSITSTGCPAGQSPAPSGVCPTGTIQYTVDYRNIVVGCSTGTEPAAACSTVSPTAGSVIITEDGTGGNAATSSNNWSTYTNGLVGAPTETTGGTNVNGASTFTYSPTPGTAAGSTKFTAKLGGNTGTLPPGATGTLVYSLVVK